MSRAARLFSRARRAALVFLPLALLGAAPAAAADTPVWYDAQPEIPATVTLAAVASGGSVVVAVGADGGVPVAYRLGDGAWTRTELAPPGTTGAAVDVAVDAHGRGWAVGWQRTGADGPVHALLERLSPDGSWTAIATGDTPALTAVAASQDLAFVGDSTGSVRSLDVDGLSAPLSWVAPGSATAVRSLALTTGLSAIGGGTPASGAPAASALFDIDGANRRVSQAPVVPAAAGAEIVAVAALPAGPRIALDGNPCGTPASGGTGAWLPDPSTGAWRRDTTFPAPAGARACDASFTPAGDALVGGSYDGQAAVWRHGAGGWTRTDGLAQGELRGIAATSDGAWGVGTHGMVLRFAIPPAPPAPDPVPQADPDPDPNPASEPPAQGPADTAPPGDAPQQGDDAQTSASSDQGADQPPPPPPVVAVSVRTSAPEPVVTGRRPQSQPVQRMLSRLAVKRLKGGRLDMRFRLRLPARLEVRALRGTDVVGHFSRRMSAGAHHVIVLYRGHKPPTRLDIVVRRSKPGASKENTR